MKKNRKALIIGGAVFALVAGTLFAFRKKIFGVKDEEAEEAESDVEEEITTTQPEIKPDKKEEEKPKDKKKPKSKVIVTLPSGKKVDAKNFADFLYVYMKGASSRDETAKATAMINMLVKMDKKDFAKVWKAFGKRDGDNLMDFYNSEGFANAKTGMALKKKYVDVKTLLV